MDYQGKHGQVETLNTKDCLHIKITRFLWNSFKISSCFSKLSELLHIFKVNTKYWEDGSVTSCCESKNIWLVHIIYNLEFILKDWNQISNSNIKIENLNYYGII